MVLFATHCLVMTIICAKSFLNPTMHNKVMGRTRTGFTEVYAQSLSLTFELATWFLFVTYCLVMMIISAKLFSNTILYGLVMARTRFWNTHTQVRLYIPFRHFMAGGIKTETNLYFETNQRNEFQILRNEE